VGQNCTCDLDHRITEIGALGFLLKLVHHFHLRFRCLQDPRGSTRCSWRQRLVALVANLPSPLSLDGNKQYRLSAVSSESCLPRVGTVNSLSKQAVRRNGSGGDAVCADILEISYNQNGGIDRSQTTKKTRTYHYLKNKTSPKGVWSRSHR